MSEHTDLTQHWDNWVFPCPDLNGQWWHNNKKVYLHVLPEEDKQEYLKKMLTNDCENK